MSLKKEVTNFVTETLRVPLVGVTTADDIPQNEIEQIAPVLRTFSQATPLAAGLDQVLHPKDFLPDARSVIIVGMPGFFGATACFEDCRAELLGKAEPSHVNIKYIERGAEISGHITSFFMDRGYQCFPLVGIQFPIKRAAALSGIGFYGKNSIIQHPDYGSWISLSAFVTDADMEPDKPLRADCGSCELCLHACPTGALYAPYKCDVSRCIDFHLGHNKKSVPVEILDKTGNLLGEGCTVCRDVCPSNKHLTPIPGFEPPRHLLYPPLLDILHMSDEEWENGFAQTLMGFFLMEKRYIQRNAVIALGNFRDKRAKHAIEHFIATKDDAIGWYGKWALEQIERGI